jgi:hypothetical protein
MRITPLAALSVLVLAGACTAAESPTLVPERPAQHTGGHAAVAVSDSSSVNTQDNGEEAPAPERGTGFIGSGD